MLETYGRFIALTFAPHALSVQQALVRTHDGAFVFSGAYVALGALAALVTLAAIVVARRRFPAACVGVAVFALTRLSDRVRRLTDLVPCENCSFAPCQYRRAPYRRTPSTADPELTMVAAGADAASSAQASAPPLDVDARYSVNLKALRRWSDERLSLARQHELVAHWKRATTLRRET